MEVTRKNFNGMLPLISASIEKADFLVIDAEFTGLLNGQNVSMFDSPQEYYVRLLNGASDFLLIQYGLCAFYWDEDKNQYMNDAYNFYLFPRGRPGPEKTFLCQSSSLDFLAAQGFDFNKLIREGISYMTEPTESRLRENLAERQKSYATEKDTITIPEENKQQIEDICKNVREFLDTKNQDEMEIDRCNAFVRRLLFQEIGARFKDEAFVESKVLENKNRVLKVTRKKSASDGDDREAKKKEKEWEEFEEAVGFSKVARMISQSEKLVIGHNMLLDLLHTLNHFFQPLPADYASFKEFAHCMFPKLLDTKYMSSLPPFKDKVNSSVLQHLLTTLSEPPFSLPKAGSQDGRGYNQSQDKHHEAGYDAYVTGLCFLAMHAHLSRMRGEPAAGRCGDCAALRPFLNKLYLARTAHQDSPYINLAGDDPTPSRDHVFHLTFPKEWQRQEINQLFSPYGQITVQFLDDVSALVALSRRDQARAALRAIGHGARISLIPYAKYKQMHDKGKQQHDKSWRKTDAESLLQVTSDSSKRGRQAPSSSATNSKPHTPPAQSTPSAQARTTRAAVAAPAQAAQPASPRSPARPERARSSSASATSPAQTTRKRTSSGVFKIDNSEPPPKRADLVQITPDVQRQDSPPSEGGRQRAGNDAKAKVKGAKAKAAKDNGQNKDKEKQSDEVFNESEKWE